jgi:cyanate lyase
MSHLKIRPNNRPIKPPPPKRRSRAPLPFKPRADSPAVYRPGLSARSRPADVAGRNGAPYKIPIKPSGSQPPASHPKLSKRGARPMTREELTEKILDTKRANGWTWKYICDEIGGMSPVLIVGALMGQHRLVKPLAKSAARLFGLGEVEERMLNEVPMRGAGMPVVPTDPLIYRFYEVVLINGPAWKALIEEEFGDGIMSAIDFDFDIERQPDPKGDRVKINMSGKFLPYKYYGATQGTPPLGLKELDE